MKTDLKLTFTQDNLPAGEEGLYAVVNNAGVAVCGEFDWQTWEQVERQVQVNLLGCLRVTKLCLPLLKKCGGGARVVNLSRWDSSYDPTQPFQCCRAIRLPWALCLLCHQARPGGLQPGASWVHPDPSCQVLRLELAKFGLSVITVQPGDFSKATHLLDSHHSNMNAM